MPMGTNKSPGWFVKVTDEVIHGLEGVESYLADVAVFDTAPAQHMRTIRSFRECLRKHNIKL